MSPAGLGRGRRGVGRGWVYGYSEGLGFHCLILDSGRSLCRHFSWRAVLGGRAGHEEEP